MGWAAPPPNVYKINVDGATASNGGCSSVGVVIRDCRGPLDINYLNNYILGQSCNY